MTLNRQCVDVGVHVASPHDVGLDFVTTVAEILVVKVPAAVAGSAFVEHGLVVLDYILPNLA